MLDVTGHKGHKTFEIGNYTINRLGFGAMRITGPGVWGLPADHSAVMATLRRLPELDVNFIDTADSYGPYISESLIRDALHPYPGMLVATKAGLTRRGPGQWGQDGRPEYLIGQAHGSLSRLGVDRIGLWQLHRIDKRVPASEQFDAIRKLIDDGSIENAGLSEVSVAEIKEASKYFKVATVQNRYNLVDRESEDVLAYCEQNGIGFIPWFPLASGELTKRGSALDEIAHAHHASPSQVALSWMLRRSPVIIPIPGTSKVKHLEENVAARDIVLADDEFELLSGIAA
ncbi:aldo/keto reductase [Rhizobium bangladeshense]|uniref:aldo/keto reductase n=1 Tax=Rhizobium bangladeshense TaxID=1138189 RepID=UPI0007E55158|nr:aldo/keto reductase [Rhizobium bangladeshense]